jgi:hypothetical protein
MPERQPLRPTYSPEAAKATGAPLVTFADTYRDEAERGAQAVAEAQRQAGAVNPSWMRKLGGLGIAALAGAGGGAEFGAKAATRFMNRPKTEAEQRVADAQAQTAANEAAIAKEAGLADTESQIAQRNAAAERDRAEAQHRAEPDDPRDKKVDEGYNAKGQRTHVYQRPDGTEYTKVFPEIVQKQNAPEHKSPFEAYAYGTAEEKQSAQDYLEFEKRMGTKYKNPTEFDERYKLFKEDPDTYRAMFGDKSGSAPDRATATKMLNYFDKRRREVNGDFTLDDDEKKQQLQEIENLERPFMEAVQPGATGGGKGDRVEVIHPNGQRGTIPRSQLGAAKKKGYREAQPQ